jgi:hypothetical protein
MKHKTWLYQIAIAGFILVLRASTVHAEAFKPFTDISPECSRNASDCRTEAERTRRYINEMCADRPDLCNDKKSRFSAYKPNYAIYQSSEDNDNSIEFRYSFRYSFTRPHCMPGGYFGDDESSTPLLGCLKKYDKRVEAFFSYTGEFDFFLNSRHSSPVVNRVSNPAFNLRKYFGNDHSFDNYTIEWLNVAIEHRSNGQTTDANEKITDPASANYGRYKAQVEYEDGNQEYFDTISRSSNYISIESKLDIGGMHRKSGDCENDFGCAEAWISAKIYSHDEESGIYWGELADSDTRFSDYDRVKLIVSDTYYTHYKYIPSIEGSIEWIIGDKFLDTDSLDIALTVPWVLKDYFKIPLYLRAHFGPMGTLSNYTVDDNSIGIGVVFR